MAQGVEMKITFPASDSDKVALDREGALQECKDPPISITSLKVMYTWLFKVT